MAYVDGSLLNTEIQEKLTIHTVKAMGGRKRVRPNLSYIYIEGKKGEVQNE